jgi:AraC-like DNA-binding protein
MSIRPNTFPNLEWIETERSESFRWTGHDFPCELARWNYHPEVEIHLIRKSHGRTFVGDYIGEFYPGYLAVVGPNIPHNWVSNLTHGEICRDRDAVLQFKEDVLRRAAEILPEILRLSPFLNATRRGLEFYGDTAYRGGVLMEEIGKERGYRRLLLFLELLDLLASSHEFRLLTSIDYTPSFDKQSAHIVHHIVEYILSDLSSARMSAASEIALMSTSKFSRFFKKNTGQNFVDFVHKVRISQACQLLANSTESITDICFACGYKNISNFNRHFLREKHLIPSAYRRMSEVKFATDVPRHPDGNRAMLSTETTLEPVISAP